MTACAPELNAPRTERTRRLVGVDIARFVALFGMFCIHFGVPFAQGYVRVWVAQFFSGRPAALSPLLAGVSLAMMPGRGEPPTGSALRQAHTRIAVRAVLLLVVGIVRAKATAATG